MASIPDLIDKIPYSSDEKKPKIFFCFVTSNFQLLVILFWIFPHFVICKQLKKKTKNNLKLCVHITKVSPIPPVHLQTRGQFCCGAKFFKSGLSQKRVL